MQPSDRAAYEREHPELVTAMPEDETLKINIPVDKPNTEGYIIPPLPPALPPTQPTNPEEDKIEIPQFIIDFQNNEEKFFQKIINKTRKNKEININEFFKKNKHYLIMTEGGKPIYSRYGDAIDNSALFATLSAIITKFTIFNSTEDKKEELKIISN